MTRNHTYLINGSFDQEISAFDRGLSYGDGVFRTMQICNGLPVNWPLHYQKLVADCAVIGIVCPSPELLMSDLQQLISIEDILENKIGVIKIIVTRGVGERGYAPPAITVPTRVLIKSAMPQYAALNYEQGVRLHVCDIQLATQTKLAGIKHINRLENVLARMEWHDDSIFDGLLLSQQGHVIECTMSNIFARFGDQLITPDLSQCGVAGITRQRILALKDVLGLDVCVATLTLDQLLQADEVIVCNSLYGAFQVNIIDKKTWAQQKLAATIRSVLGYD